jgi:hypothetical protein
MHYLCGVFQKVFVSLQKILIAGREMYIVGREI